MSCDYKEEDTIMAENASNQEMLRVTVNGNCSIFVPDTFEKYQAELKEYMDAAPSPYTTIRLEGYADYNLREKAEVFCKVTDCIRVVQFMLPD